ncbi:MAG: HesB/IscA family protein, partial [Ilumatobacteraceae bacterium]
MITLTDKAAVKVKQLLESENATDLALRVAVRPGGCSGYSYEMFFDGEFAADDVVKTFGEVKVV